MEHCATYADKRPFRFVLLGDYIDRGPDSAGVMRLVKGLSSKCPDAVLCLKGNHEEMLLGVIDSPGDLMWWINNGGETTLTSYGAKRISEIPSEHIAWLRTLPLYHDDGLRFFVHAGSRSDYHAFRTIRTYNVVDAGALSRNDEPRSNSSFMGTRHSAPAFQNFTHIGSILIRARCSAARSRRRPLTPNRLRRSPSSLTLAMSSSCKARLVKYAVA